MPTPQFTITATGSVDLTMADDNYIGSVVIEIVLSAGTFSATPRVTKQGGSGAYFNASYFTFPTKVANAAGTAISAAGIYEVPADGCVVNLNVTALSGGTLTLYVTKSIGSAGAGSAVGGGTSSSAPTFVTPALGTKTLAQTSVTTSAVLLLAANTSRKAAVIENTGATSVYLGKDNTVISTTGFLLAAGAAFTDRSSSDAWYGIAASGTDVVCTIEVA